MLLNVCELREKSTQWRRYLSYEHNGNYIYWCAVTPYGVFKAKNFLAKTVKVLTSLLVNLIQVSIL